MQNFRTVVLGLGIAILLGVGTALVVRLFQAEPAKAKDTQPAETVVLRSRAPRSSGWSSGKTVVVRAQAEEELEVLQEEPEDAGAVRVSNHEVGHSIPLSSLRENCAGGHRHEHDPAEHGDAEGQHEHAEYKGEFVSKLSVRIPTNTQAETAFDFCVQALRLGQHQLKWGEDGWAHGKDNPELGINGPWFAFSDDHTKWNNEEGQAAFTAGEGICVSGTAPRVIDGKYEEYWGAGLGLNFYHTGAGEEQAGLYRPNFESINLVVTGSQIPRKLRVSLDNGEEGEGSKEWCTNAITTQQMLAGSTNR